jgi:hypothetical protein
MPFARWVVGAALVAACGDDGAAGDTETPGTTTSGDTSGDGTLDPPATSTNGDDVLDDTSSGGDDDGPVMGECILWGADCSDDAQKCMPWAMEGGPPIPEETRCCALEDNPDLVGEPCTVQDYDGSCLDSCEEGSMCVVDNPESLSGVCRRFCDPGDLTDCPDTQTCKTFFELLPGVLTVPMCMDKCDPLLQDCVQSGWHCIPDSPTPAGQSGFICTPPPPDEPNQIFDGCALANQCEAGLVCLTPDRVPGCESVACCSAYCSLSEGDAPCQALDPNMQCVDWMSPDPDWEDVGACAIPQ